MFRCLVIFISLYYVHTGLAIFYLATILRLDHVWGVQSSRVWRKCRFLKHSISRRQHAGAWALERRLSSPPTIRTSPSRRQDNMDRASQVLAQGVPPGVPKSYRALAYSPALEKLLPPKELQTFPSIGEHMAISVT